MTTSAVAPAARPVRTLSGPERALLHAVDLGVLAVTATGLTVTLLAAAIAGSVTNTASAGIAAATTMSVAFVWITRVTMQRASAGPAEAIGSWVLVSYAAKAVLILVGLTLASKDGDVNRAAFGLSLVAGVVVSVALQALLWRPGKTDTVQPVATVPDRSYDDDAAVAAARQAHVTRLGSAATRGPGGPAGQVTDNVGPTGNVPAR